MTDIVEPLRNLDTATCEDAADEIERLKAKLRTASDMNDVYEGRLQEKEADNERLRAALRMFACACADEHLCSVPDNCRNYLARAALEGK